MGQTCRKEEETDRKKLRRDDQEKGLKLMLSASCQGWKVTKYIS